MPPAYGIEPAHLLAVIDGCQMDLEQTRYLDYPGAAALLPPGGRRRRRGRGEHLRPDRAADHRLRAQAGPGDAADQHHPRRRRGRACAAASTCRSTSCSVRRQGARDAATRTAVATASASTALMRFQAERAHRTYDEALALLPEADRRGAEARADDGQHLPHAAARDRARRLPGAAPAHRADAAAQAAGSRWRTHWRGR